MKNAGLSWRKRNKAKLLFATAALAVTGGAVAAVAIGSGNLLLVQGAALILNGATAAALLALLPSPSRPRFYSVHPQGPTIH